MKKRTIIPILLVIIFFISGCSLHPQKMNAGQVEEIVKEAINKGVYLADEEPKIQDLYDGRHYIYSFEDERGIPFEVEVSSQYYSLMGFHKGFYESYVCFRTDYREAIMNYYNDKIEEVLNKVDGISFDEKDKKIIRISDETAIDSLEDVLIKIDDIYDFNYAYSGELRLKINKNAYWEDFNSYDLLIRYNGNQADAIFTVSDDEIMSTWTILSVLKGNE